MTVDRRVWLLVALVAAGTLVTGTTGFSAAEVDRGVTVTVADDHAGGFVPLADPGAHGTHPAPWWVEDRSRLRGDPVTAGDPRVGLFLVHNRFPTAMDVTARFDGGEVERVSDLEPTTLERGETGVVAGTVDCGTHRGPGAVFLNVTVSAESLSAHVGYRVTVVCAGQSAPGEPAPASPESGGPPAGTG